MSTKFITTTGASNNFLETPDLNILDTDDAHGHQAIGGWGTQGANTIATVTDTDDSLVHPFFTQGGFTKVFKVTYQDDQDLADLTLPTLTAAGHIFITSVWFPSNWDGGNVTIDDNGTFASETGVSNQDAVGATTESWQTTWRKFTPDAGDLVGTLTLDCAGTPTAGRVMYFAMNCVRADQVETQVASMRFVKTFDLRSKLAADDWTTGGNRVIVDTYSGSSGYQHYMNTGDLPYITYRQASGNKAQTATSYTLSDGIATEIKIVPDIDTGDFLWYEDGGLVETDAVVQEAMVPSGLSFRVAALLSGGVAWDGDIQYVEARDGIDGPICVKMFADDAHTALGGGAITNGATWTGSDDGRTWTATGAAMTLLPLPTAAASGTIVAGGVLEQEIVAGGETLIITLTDGIWDADMGTDDGSTDALIAGIDSDGAEAAGWDAVVKANMVFGDVARTSDTVVTITLGAEPTYLIDNDETITVTVPAAAIIGPTAPVAAPTFDVTAVATATATGTIVAGGVAEAEIVAGGETLIITLTGDIWHNDMGSDDASTTALIAGITSAGAETLGWNNVVKANLAFGDIARTSDKVVTITLGAEATYQITVNETITVTVPTAAIDGDTAIVAAPTFAITRLAPPGEGTYAGLGSVRALRDRLTADGYTPAGFEPPVLVAQIVGSTIVSEVLGHLRGSAGATKNDTLAALHEVIAADGGTISDVGDVESALVRFAEVYDL